MALTLPSTDAFVDFWGDEAEDFDEDRAEALIELSANLLWLATGLENDPEDDRLAMLVTYAILDMAIYLAISRENINESYSPYQSERIGSYSYSKAYNQAQRSVMNGSDTGVMFFDKVVQYLLDDALYTGGLTTSENVFHRGYQPLYFVASGFARVFREADPNMDRRALYGYFGNADDDEGMYLP